MQMMRFTTPGILLLGLLLVWSLVSKAQQFPQYSLHMNSYVYNPAIAGINNYLDTKASLRQQYSGVEGAPVTAYVSAHKPINQGDINKKELESLPMRGVYQVRFRPSQRQKIRHGLGGFVMNDQTALLDRTQANLGYSIHIPWGRTFYAAFGTSVGFSNFSLGSPNTLINFGDVNGTSDNAFTGNSTEMVFPEINFGTWIYTPKYYFGASVIQVLGNDLRFSTVTEGMNLDEARLKNHFVVNGGYKFRIGTDIDLVPNVMMKYVLGQPAMIEGGLRAYYQGTIWGGALYRFADFTHENPESVAVQAGLNINRLIEIGFAYDYNLFELNTSSRGSFEVVLGMRLFNKRNADTRLW